MFYTSIDLETTGLNPKTADIVEFAAVLGNSKNPAMKVEDLPSFHAYVVHDTYQGQPTALGMHGEIFKRIAEERKPYNYFRQGQLLIAFKAFLELNVPNFNGKITAAGKNFASFDLQFLKKYGMDHFFGHRVLDPGSLFFDPEIDEKIPDLKTCLERSGYTHTVSHTALEDAQDVVKCLNFYWMTYGS